MGILNATPDSFSDGGRYTGAADAIAAGEAMAAEGAAILDVGGESTRPGAALVTRDEEMARVLPVICALAGRGHVVSVDTRDSSVMAAALEAGAAIVNDVSGLTHDPSALSVCARAGCGVVLMHMRGTPATMASLTHYADVVAEVRDALAALRARAVAAGIPGGHILLDPGIGFAKDLAQNIALLRDLRVLVGGTDREPTPPPAPPAKGGGKKTAPLPLREALGEGRVSPILIGVSRKKFIGALSGVTEPRARDAGSLAAALFAAARGASVLRVHDVAGTVQALKVWRALASPGLALELP